MAANTVLQLSFKRADLKVTTMSITDTVAFPSVTGLSYEGHHHVHHRPQSRDHRG